MVDAIASQTRNGRPNLYWIHKAGVRATQKEFLVLRTNSSFKTILATLSNIRRGVDGSSFFLAQGGIKTAPQPHKKISKIGGVIWVSFQGGVSGYRFVIVFVLLTPKTIGGKYALL